MSRKPPSLLDVDERKGVATVRVDRSIYPLDAIYGAAYELLDRAYVVLAARGRGTVLIQLHRKPEVDAPLASLAGDLASRLLDHALRVSLAKRHGRVRELIVARALAGAGATGQAPADQPAPSPADDDPFAVGDEWEASRKTGPGRR